VPSEKHVPCTGLNDLSIQPYKPISYLVAAFAPMFTKLTSKRLKIGLLFLAFSLNLPAQTSSPPSFFYPAQAPDTKRINGLVLSEAIGFSGALLALHFLWYKKFTHSRFHFFNDNREWLQMDKMGHATTAYNLGVLGTDVYRWSGMENNRAIWYGGTTGLLFLTAIELLDGFSSGWGFSGGDMLANTAGSALVIGQNLAWNEQRLSLKFSYHKSIYAAFRPEELGKGFGQRVLKDYNGQSYWLSANIWSFLAAGNGFPKWLNVAVGFGAEGMVSGSKDYVSDPAHPIPFFERSRKFFFSADVDFRRIPSTNQAALITFKAINFLKVPAPAIEFIPSKKKIKLDAFYF
jgi:hypothetical protein